VLCCVRCRGAHARGTRLAAASQNGAADIHSVGVHSNIRMQVDQVLLTDTAQVRAWAWTRFREVCASLLVIGSV
jgi:hypothetical protein